MFWHFRMIHSAPAPGTATRVRDESGRRGYCQRDIRQVVHGEDNVRRRYLVIAPGTAETHGPVVQVQVD